MVNYLVKFFSLGKNKILNVVRRINSFSCPIIKTPEDFFEIISIVKSPSWEKAYYAECYGHNREQQLDVYSPADVIYKINDGLVVEGSDVVVTDHGALWGKYNQEEFCTFMVPMDTNLLSFNRNYLRLVKSKKIEHISGRVISLLGCCAHHWVHSIYEFLPRLFSAGEAGLLNAPTTILVIDNQDKTILEIISLYLKKFPCASIKMVNNGVAYKCEELYFQPVVGPSCSGYKFRLDYPWYIPRYIIDQANRYIVTPSIKSIKDNKTFISKIFLGRNSRYSVNARNLINYNEVRAFFLENGFVDIEASTLSLEEKSDIFYHAKEIVAIHGSSLMNLLFCNQAKCIVLGNYRFATDPILYPFIRDKVSRYVYVTGQDLSSDFHSDFYIPLDKIKKVYQDLFLSITPNE